jgi:Concanavalin A-like lectin/glucanases superfamily
MSYAKIGAIVLAIILFIVIIILLKKYVWTPQISLSSKQPGNTLTTINSSSIPSGVSYNFTYSIWLYIDDWSYNYGSEKIIFTKGDSPKVSLGANENDLNVSMKLDGGDNTFMCGLPNVPLQRWTNVIITLNGRSMDLYLNGKLTRTCLLKDVPKTDTTSNLLLTPNGGFSGYTTNFKYWSDTINPQQAWNIYKSGPGGNIFSNFLGNYQIQLNFLNGNNTAATMNFL